MECESQDSPASSRGPSSAAARSCTTCAKAKTRCVKATANSVCDRCARLRKECVFKEPVVKRKKIAKSSRAAQFEKLENKIEHLVNALSASQNRPSSDQPGQPSPPVSQADDTSLPNGVRQYEVLNSLCGEISNAGPPQKGQVQHCTPPQHSNHQQSSCPGITAAPSALLQAENQGLGVSLSEAEILLDRYCRLMAPSLPFVILPYDVTAAGLYSTKPFLLRSIVTVACIHDQTKQTALLKHCMRELAERVLVNNEKNLGLIEAMLVLITWFHPHVFASGQLTNLLGLGNAMCTDLSIDRSPHHCAGFKTSTSKAMEGHTPAPRQHTLEENRIFAGVWYVSSMFATAFIKFHGHPYSKYLDECIDRLQAAREYESDLFLVQTVRLQHLVEDAHDTSPTVPSQLYITAFETRLARIKEQGQPTQENTLLKMHYLKASVHLWELGLNELMDTRTQPLQNYMEGIYNMTKAVKAALDVFFTIPTSTYLLLPFSAFNHFAHSFINLTKIESLEIEGWDPRNLDHIVDFSATMDRVISDFESVSESSPDGLAVENDTFKAWAGKIKWMKQVYHSKFGPENSATSKNKSLGSWRDPCSVLEQEMQAASPQHLMQQGQQPTPPEDYLSTDFSFSNMDEAFWSSFAFDLEMDVQKYLGPGAV